MTTLKTLKIIGIVIAGIGLLILALVGVFSQSNEQTIIDRGGLGIIIVTITSIVIFSKYDNFEKTIIHWNMFRLGQSWLRYSVVFFLFALTLFVSDKSGFTKSIFPAESFQEFFLIIQSIIFFILITISLDFYILVNMVEVQCENEEKINIPDDLEALENPGVPDDSEAPENSGVPDDWETADDSNEPPKPIEYLTQPNKFALQLFDKYWDRFNILPRQNLPKRKDFALLSWEIFPEITRVKMQTGWKCERIIPKDTSKKYWVLYDLEIDFDGRILKLKRNEIDALPKLR